MKEQYDVSGGKRGAVIKTNKEKITIRLDPDVVDWFRKQVEGGSNYQSLINEALKAQKRSSKTRIPKAAIIGVLPVY
ncbi:BrnA antitoxin family protein [Thiothrix unzii]|uniref:BrnA antitoxin family protein n=1 Tax=Thiothrix unzii TaxID=111769 RepID=A0A975FBP4_9GAMM|nr:BrnA antitoxin family protein [Thiothrix unzii]QTR54554.1 BrnA antitoxin family protein [Thiothrix unzii]